MFRLIRTFVYVALAFTAGVQFERADAGTTCQAEADWTPYLSCVSREVLSELIS